MTPDDAIRYLDHEAAQCRGRDAGEALCLLLPAMLKVLGLERMDDFEAAAFRHGFKRDLDALTDRLARPASINGVTDRARSVPAEV
jgi:hypothetical protein